MSVKLVKVDRTYSFLEKSVYALRGIKLQIRKGEFVAFAGPAGAGKTTLLNLIGAVDKPSKGKIYFNRTDLAALLTGQLAKFKQRKIGFIFQNSNLIPVLSVYENVELPMLAAGVNAKEREVRAKELIEAAGLAEYMHYRPNELSRSQEQQVAILCALANRPTLVLADEPSGDLNPEEAKTLVQMLRDLSRHAGATLIMATRDPSVTASASRVFEMENGRIIKMHVNVANKLGLAKQPPITAKQKPFIEVAAN